MLQSKMCNYVVHAVGVHILYAVYYTVCTFCVISCNIFCHISPIDVKPVGYFGWGGLAPQKQTKFCMRAEHNGYNNIFESKQSPYVHIQCKKWINISYFIGHGINRPKQNSSHTARKKFDPWQILQICKLSAVKV